MTPRHTQGCGGAACYATAHPRAQQTKSWCVGLFFPPPAYAGIRPTLFLFGFRADALNSHSSFINNGPATDGPSFEPERSLQGLPPCRGLQRSPGACRGPAGPFRGLDSHLFGLMPGDPEISAFPSHLQGRPGQGHSQDHTQKTQKGKVAGFRVSSI